ncbi:MAG: ATP synthase F1 subunit delta [Candidatus Magasanikbacteria bacterium RIFCSPHIGHO2_01_FULL_47_8]|uniref:ATP synthase subunit delta n=1 Tax=Candidatus Magasanikbacteria bacterium RIFCSPHIGHO2_01_FULL_47_8 TaxID=1798673 RepID=A0A1F6MAR6_9BACT|nr:MAG: ATP synthase F1 subunit delta [Candidatus Magasanikbacteria bacterium RIFCSPHIGHO2_01_FULL_47_8]
MINYTPKQYAQALHLAISESNPKDQERILDNFVQVLKSNGHLGLLDEIEKEFLRHDREQRGVKQAEITTAKPLSRDEEAKLIHNLNEYVGGKVELKKKVDEGLIGGIMVKIGDELIDGSVKKSLQELKNKLKE